MSLRMTNARALSVEKYNKFGPGNVPALTLEIERELVNWLNLLMDKGFPAGWLDVEVAAIQFAEVRFEGANDNIPSSTNYICRGSLFICAFQLSHHTHTPKKCEPLSLCKGKVQFRASHGWRDGFKRCHPEVCSRIAHGLERTRVGGLNEDNVSKYFKILEEEISEIEKLNGCKITGEPKIARSYYYFMCAGYSMAFFFFYCPADLILNIDGTGLDLVNGLKGLRVGIMTKKNRRFFQVRFVIPAQN